MQLLGTSWSGRGTHFRGRPRKSWRWISPGSLLWSDMRYKYAAVDNLSAHLFHLHSQSNCSLLQYSSYTILLELYIKSSRWSIFWKSKDGTKLWWQSKIVGIKSFRSVPLMQQKYKPYWLPRTEPVCPNRKPRKGSSTQIGGYWVPRTEEI